MRYKVRRPVGPIPAHDRIAPEAAAVQGQGEGQIASHGIGWVEAGQGRGRVVDRERKLLGHGLAARGGTADGDVIGATRERCPAEDARGGVEGDSVGQRTGDGDIARAGERAAPARPAAAVARRDDHQGLLVGGTSAPGGRRRVNREALRDRRAAAVGDLQAEAELTGSGRRAAENTRGRVKAQSAWEVAAGGFRPGVGRRAARRLEGDGVGVADQPGGQRRGRGDAKITGDGDGRGGGDTRAVGVADQETDGLRAWLTPDRRERHALPRCLKAPIAIEIPGIGERVAVGVVGRTGERHRLADEDAVGATGSGGGGLIGGNSDIQSLWGLDKASSISGPVAHSVNAITRDHKGHAIGLG